MRYYIAKYSIYIFLFCLTYLILRWIFITLLGLQQVLICSHVYLHEIVIFLVSFLVVKKCFKVDRLD